MNRPVKFLLAAAALVVVAGVVLFLWARLRPLAAYAAAGRRALAKAGLTKASVSSSVGPQTAFSGGSGPVLVLLHGAGDQAATWSLVAPKLLPGRTLVVPDLAGHGASAPVTGPLSVETLLVGLSAVLDEAAPKERVTLVGNSLGAWLACLWAREHPERVERIVLVNGGPLKHEAKGLTLLPTDLSEARKAVEALRDPGSIRVPDFVLDDVVRQAAKGPLARLAATSGEMDRYVLDGRLGELNVPVEIVWGASDRMLPVSYAERMLAQLPRARLTELPRCGHVPQQECPAAFAEALGNLLAGPPPGATAPAATADPRGAPGSDGSEIRGPATVAAKPVAP